MATGSDNAPLVVIVGETASGKSALALELARQFNGEIIAADSRTVYRGMDIGTAKPTKEEQAIVSHHMIDIANPDHSINVAEYKRLALEAIDDITSRGKPPFLVGGTGLYVDAVIFDFKFSGTEASPERAKWESLSVEELQAKLTDLAIPLPINDRNPRHLIRQLETGGVSAERSSLRPKTLVLGMQTDKDESEKRVVARIDKMFERGLEAEVQQLVTQYGWVPAFQTIGYQEFRPYFEGQVSIEDVYAAIVRATLQYAKRQRTWFKRNPSIIYISEKEEAVDAITTLLSK